MRKTTLIVLTVFLLVGILSLTVGCSQAKTPSSISQFGNLANGEFNATKGAKGDSIVYDFKQEVKVNAIVLKEKGDNITKFRLFADDEQVEFYGNDYIGGYRYCSFSEIELTKLTLIVDDCRDNWQISDIEAYYITKTADNFDTMAYVTTDSILFEGMENSEYYSKVTQFNVISSLYHDKDGNIIFKDIDDGNNLSGREDFEKALATVREANPQAKIVATILGNQDFTGDGLSIVQRHSMAMGDNADTLIKSILEIIQRYELDGISFDYEYPDSISSNNTYAKFLQQLKDSMPEGKILTIAMSEWQLGIGKLSVKDLDCVDKIELMAYDLFDEYGDHSTFYKTAYDIIDKIAGHGLDLSKVNLGVPFYSRPVNHDEFWGNYKDVAQELSPWENSYIQDYTDIHGNSQKAVSNYYNGRQMIYDKTCFAIDSGLGGIMIWHIACDSQDPELSLLYQIERAVNSRK